MNIERLVPPGRRSVLAIGTATHAGLAAFHGGEDMAAAQKIASETLKAEANPVSGFEDKTLSEAQEVVDRIFPAYVEYWQDKGEVWKPINQEIQCLVPVGDPSLNIWLRMKADNLSTWKGGLYLVDYKTAGRMDPRDLAKYELDIQLSAYIYGLSKFFTELAKQEDPNAEHIFIRGAIIDVLVKTQTPQFARELYTRTDDELEEFEAEFVEIASVIRSMHERVQAGEPWKTVFFKNTEACFRYGRCPYHDVCVKDTPVRRALYDARDPDYVDEAQRELDAKWERGEI
jgi:hypothetical protein